MGSKSILSATLHSKELYMLSILTYPAYYYKHYQMLCKALQITVLSKIDFEKLNFWKLLIFSLGRTVTKNQWLNTKCQPKFFIDVSFCKENRPGWSLLFSKRINKNNFCWHLVFSNWFSFTGLSNEKKIWPDC